MHSMRLCWLCGLSVTRLNSQHNSRNIIRITQNIFILGLSSQDCEQYSLGRGCQKPHYEGHHQSGLRKFARTDHLLLRNSGCVCVCVEYYGVQSLVDIVVFEVFCEFNSCRF